MGLIGSIAGGLTSIAGSALSAKAQNRAYDQYIKDYQNRLQEVKDHRDNLYYQDPTQTAENQVAVTNAKKVLDNATQTAKNTNIVSGGSDESVALSKQAAQEQVGNMMQNAALQGAQQKENTWNTADQQINTFTNYIATAKKEKGLGQAKAIQNAASGLASAANSMPF